jgi:hypothetical protein
MSVLVAAEIPEFALTTLKVFSLIGIAAVGGLVLGWMAAMIARLYFAQKIPGGPMWFIRVLGGVASGLVAFYILFGGGGSGIGGGGWGWGGSGGSRDGAPKKDGTVAKDRDREKDGKNEKKNDRDGMKVTPEQSLRVEVLGDAALRRLTKSSDFDGSKRYRLAGGPGLLTLDEVKKQVLARRDADPPLLLVEILLYSDSPDRRRPQVGLLETWAKDLSRADAPLTVKVSDVERDAP